MKNIILALTFVSSLALAQAPEVQPSPVDPPKADDMATVTPPTKEQKANVEKPVKAAARKHAAKHAKHAKRAKKAKKSKKHTH